MLDRPEVTLSTEETTVEALEGAAGRITGVVLNRDGVMRRVCVRRGVALATGGGLA